MCGLDCAHCGLAASAAAFRSSVVRANIAPKSGSDLMMRGSSRPRKTSSMVTSVDPRCPGVSRYVRSLTSSGHRFRRHTMDLGSSRRTTLGANFWPGASGTRNETRSPSAILPSMLVRVEFHFDCASRSVRRFQTVVDGAAIDLVTATASRKVVRVVVAFPSEDSSATAVTNRPGRADSARRASLDSKPRLPLGNIDTADRCASEFDLAHRLLCLSVARSEHLTIG